MPGPLAHTVLALAVLEEWQGKPHLSPLGRMDSSIRRAFLAGALMPDAGYLPGGLRLFSDAAHYVKSGQLVSEMLKAAREPEEQALALGWLTHVVADSVAHPLVNASAGRIFGRSSQEPMTYDQDRLAHAWVESLLDGHLLVGNPTLRDVSWQLQGQRSLAGWLVSVFESCYDHSFSIDDFQATLNGPERLRQNLIRFSGVVGSRGRPGGIWRNGGEGLVLAFMGIPLLTLIIAVRYPHILRKPGSWLDLDPVLKSQWDDSRTDLVERCVQLAGDSSEQLPDLNLDTGIPEGRSRDYPPLAATRKQLGLVPHSTDTSDLFNNQEG
jgi:hypothetical protein